MRGRFSCVMTSITPVTRSASLVSMRTMRPFAIVDATMAAVNQAVGVELGGVFRRAGDLGAAIDARRRRSDVIGHCLTALSWSICDCGVPCAAWVSARTMALRASSILNALCA